ncbi:MULTISPECIES: hypothetical protein [Psychrilyobacter]|uniref:Lipoprotein n=1 Tax=Psychrilyobacter piezotolerans TaxID=2293438 RepID=A0ABX9KKU4_9FUSO|nr:MULTISPECIES: hypothetical protein [Psychrilyobacter]MCS5420549.1 hypothetical protein [Psychrilyobacter sp. S5]NDI76655.1 hypothetical protein [Psychrilyobacter piezotolerans]RDE65280.1 hypothetical protein DV867_01755 [Psychrilyobacter sp. S5]REI42898.1 hypothetical protein DYH56_01755 [Psychrilyobacter piezotolerans]
MKKTLCILGLMVFLVGCDSISAKGKLGSIQINDSSNYKKSNKSNGNALGHKNPKNPHYKGGSNSSININL